MKLLKIQPLPQVLRVQAIRSKQLTYISAKDKFITGQKTKEKNNLLLVKMKEKKLLKMQSLPKVLRSQAMRSTT
jgi:hypothetical protein